MRRIPDSFFQCVFVPVCVCVWPLSFVCEMCVSASVGCQALGSTISGFNMRTAFAFAFAIVLAEWYSWYKSCSPIPFPFPVPFPVLLSLSLAQIRSGPAVGYMLLTFAMPCRLVDKKVSAMWGPDLRPQYISTHIRYIALWRA